MISGGWQQLPSAVEVVRRFGLFDTGRGCSPQVSCEGVVTCYCHGCASWAAYLRGTLQGGPSFPSYEVLTSDLIFTLANCIRELAVEKIAPGRVVRVLEVGAGDGQVAHYVTAALQGGRYSVRASDNGSLGLHSASAFGYLVSNMDAEEAVEEGQPDIVLCCWMPLGTDWSAAFRQCRSVVAYVLVGQADSGMCGRMWDTWGSREREGNSRTPDRDNSWTSDRNSNSSSSDSSSCECSSSEHRRCCIEHSDSDDCVAGSCRCGCVSGGSRVRRRISPDSNGTIPVVTAHGCDSECTGRRQVEAIECTSEAVKAADCHGYGRSVVLGSRRTEALSAPAPTPYIADGFERRDISARTKLAQVCRMDERWSTRRHSAVVAFVRRK